MSFSYEIYKEIFEHLIKPTLHRMSYDFESYPEFRKPFFKLVNNIIDGVGVFQQDTNNLEIIVKAAIFGMRHT